MRHHPGLRRLRLTLASGAGRALRLLHFRSAFADRQHVNGQCSRVVVDNELETVRQQRLQHPFYGFRRCRGRGFGNHVESAGSQPAWPADDLIVFVDAISCLDEVYHCRGPQLIPTAAKDTTGHEGNR